MIDLKLEVKNYIKENVLRKVKENNTQCGNRSQFNTLIVDKNSTKLLSSCFTMDELAAEGITSIDSVEKHREPYSTMGGIYLLTPNDINIHEIISDMQRDFYASFHIFFTESCPEKLFSCAGFLSLLL